MEWTSVKDKDKLPKEKDNFPSDLVLVAFDDGEIRVGYCHKGEMKISCNSCSEDRYITHWMPLPEPPKV